MPGQAYNCVERVFFGTGCLDQLPEELDRLKAKRVFVVTDQGVRKAGLVDGITERLAKAGVAFQVFADVMPDPEIACALAATEAARSFGTEVILGLGGGSSLDTAKAVSCMLANEGPIDRYFGMELVPNAGPPTILIPTTAGTGSEMTSISVLADPQTQTKQGVVSRHLYARVALLDPMLTMTLPPHITATTGADALVHAIESYVGLRANVFTETVALKAIELLGANLRRAYANGDDIEARSNMLYGSTLAGMGFSNTQTGLCHAIAMGIGGIHHLPHGLLTAAVIPWVMDFNAIASPSKFIQIARALGEPVDNLSERDASMRASRFVRQLLDDVGISYRLRDYSVTAEEFPAVARATLLAKRLTGNNPRKIVEADVIQLLEANY